MHAREWVAIPTAIEILQQVLNNPQLRKNKEFQFILVANPDGYRHTYTKVSQWQNLEGGGVGVL